MPEPGTALGHDGRIYAIGGYGAARGGPAVADTVITAEAYDPATRLWEEIAPIEAEAWNEMGAATGSDGRIYALSSGGGDPDGATTCFHAYDPATGAWTALVGPDVHYALWGPTVLAGPDGHIYATDGSVGPELTMHAYDPAAGEWRRLRSPETPRWGFGAAVGLDGRFYLAGGGPESGAVAYDPDTDRWHELGPMPAPRWMVAAAMGFDGCLYVVGGYAEHELTGAVDVYAP
jgi:hypothetical protein